MTTAGPTLCHDDVRRTVIRAARRRPRSRSKTAPPTSATATQSGTAPGGRTKSIGTSTSSVGTAEPGPISNSIRDTTR